MYLISVILQLGLQLCSCKSFVFKLSKDQKVLLQWLALCVHQIASHSHQHAVYPKSSIFFYANKGSLNCGPLNTLPCALIYVKLHVTGSGKTSLTAVTKIQRHMDKLSNCTVKISLT